MKALIEGVRKFQSEVFAGQKELFSRLAHGQHPQALFITCSDSRIDPCLLTQTHPGELFILRNAGNIVPSYGAQIGGTTATIEYAVGVLGVKNVIVCGHTDCGVAKGILDPGQAKDLPSLREWLLQAEATRRIIQENYAHLKGDELLTAAIQENVRVQLAHLRTHPLIAAKLRRGTIELHGWVYSIPTGQVWAFDDGRDQFMSLSQTSPNEPKSSSKRRK
jgi:carbonic anhydrase